MWQKTRNKAIKGEMVMRYAINIYSSGGDLVQGYYNLTLYFDTLDQALDYEAKAGIGFLNIEEIKGVAN